MDIHHLVIIGCGSLMVIGIAVGTPLGQLLPRTTQFKVDFIKRCEDYQSRNYCSELWTTFEKAFVGKSPCDVPVNAYDPLMKLDPFNHQCSETLFWSKTKNLASLFTKHKQCFTLEATLLGSIMDGQIWCGEEGSKEIYVTEEKCSQHCANNPVRSFWDRASAAFAEYACSEVTVLLNGALEEPFDITSTFGRVELAKLNTPRVKNLTAILVTGKGSDCNSANIQALREAARVRVNCYDVPADRVERCASSSNMGCAKCLKASQNVCCGQFLYVMFAYLFVYAFVYLFVG